MADPYRLAIIATRGALLLLALAAWEWLGRLADPALFTSASATWHALWNQVLAQAPVRAAIGGAFLEVLAAYALSIIVGVVAGLGIGWNMTTRRRLYPLVLLLYAIPQVIVLPLFVITFGIGPLCKIAFGFTHGVFPVVVNVVAGMRGVNQQYLRGAQAMGASRFEIALHVYLPHMVPSLFTGLRLAMTLTMLGVILSELYVSSGGIGYFTRFFAEGYDPAPLFALIGVLAAMAILLNTIVRIAERRFTRWRT
jgi:ABC-type nitrate/sulfonate/bicarbonate transport system permease component